MKARYLNAFLLFVLLDTVQAPIACAAAGSAESPFRTYSVADGLTQSDVYEIDQDRAGYLWFTTARGLNRFDGTDFFHLTIADGLPSNAVTALEVDASNTVWVGNARGGLSLVRGGRVISTIEPFDDRISPISDIKFADGSAFVIAQGIGILQATMLGDRYVLQPLYGEDPEVRSMAVANGSIWVSASSGLYRLTSEPRIELKLESKDIVHAAADGNTLWVVDTSNRVGVWTNGRFDPRAAIDSTMPIGGIAVDPNGPVWVSTETEVFSFDGSASGGIVSKDNVRRFDGFDQILSIFVDRESTLWISANSRLIRFLGDRFRHYKLRTGSEAEGIWGMAEDNDGRLWIGTRNKLLLRNHDGSLTVVGPRYGLPIGPVRDVVRGADGRIWVGIRGEGLYVIDPDSLRGQRVDGTEGLEVLDAAVADDSVIWFSTAASGVFRYSYKDGSLENYATPKNAPVYTIDIWSDGSVWYGADEVALVHLTRLNKNEFRQVLFDDEHGLTHNLFNHVQLVAENEAWVATEEGGLYHFVDSRFHRHGAGAPYADQTIYVVQPLENGSVIVGGEQGIYQFVPGSDRTVHYNQLAGFLGLETNVHATYVDSKGGLWIGTVDGVSRMETAMAMAPHVELTPQILSMANSLGGDEISDGAEIAPGQRGAFVEYGAVSLTHPRNLEFSYQLVGVDDQWSAATPNRTVSYSRIPPGDYAFHVRARYPGGDWSRETVGRQFTVLPFFWQRPMIVLLAATILLLAVRTALVYRTRNIQKLNEKLVAQVAERTRSIERAREKLQISNEQLSTEIQERRKSDQARAEVETRFRRAFQNAPIGMGLLDLDGKLFDANPALLKMLWPTVNSLSDTDFSDALDDADKERFTNLYHKLVSGQLESIDEKFSCVDSAGGSLNTEVNLSTVESDSGEYLYSVLQIQDVTESLKLTDQLEYQATYDELTGLLNRRAFEAELIRAWEHGRGAATKSYLMFMDLDQFKVVNDTSGHAAGDMLLKQISEMLVDSVRANDTVGRLGGDEFAIILWKCPVEVAQRIAEAIRASIEAFRFHWEKETYRIGVSVGGIPIDPDVGDTGELQQLADAACYAAKEAGRNRVHMVAGDKDSARAHRGQVRWVQRLREAMDKNRFAIYGQAIKPLDDSLDEPERFEILLRLRDPVTRKLIPPGAFLPAAERYGLSLELDEWVVRSLLNALFIHQSFHAEYRRYWINLSGTSIGEPRFVSFLKNMIEHSPLPAGTINFEISETAVIRNVSEASKLMTELRHMGCQFALDDFGSGVSSFGYLKKLPVDYVKIDGSYIRTILDDQANRIFVKSIIDIAHTLNIKTVCEFIENDEMLDVVRGLGADYVQGFAVGRPFVLAPRFPGSAELPTAAVPELQQQAG